VLTSLSAVPLCFYLCTGRVLTPAVVPTSLFEEQRSMVLFRCAPTKGFECGGQAGVPASKSACLLPT